jgi:hypothetical protein
MSQFISPGILAQLLSGAAGKAGGGGATGPTRGRRDSGVEVVEASSSREEPGSASRIRVTRVREA